MDPGRWIAAELDAVADEILEQLEKLGAVRHDFAKGIAGNHRVPCFDHPAEIGQSGVENSGRVHGLKLLHAGPRPGIAQQISDQLLQPPDALQGIAKVSGRVLIQRLSVSSFQKPQVTSDGDKRFLEIVRRHVGKLLQFAVAPLQFRGQGFQPCLRGDPLFEHPGDDDSEQEKCGHGDDPVVEFFGGDIEQEKIPETSRRAVVIEPFDDRVGDPRGHPCDNREDDHAFS